MSLFFFKQKTAYEVRISDWSSDVCASDLVEAIGRFAEAKARLFVKRGIVAKPDDNSAGIGIEVALVIAVEKRFEDSRGHDGLAGASGGGWREGGALAFFVPPPTTLSSLVEDFRDGVVLVILPRKFHAPSPAPHRKIGKGAGRERG